MPVRASHLIIAGTGGIILWSGLRGKKWSSVLRDVIAGKNPASAQKANLISDITPSSGGGSSNFNYVPGSNKGGSPTKNQLLARTILAATHPSWTVGSEWQSLVSLWTRESGWSETADNPQSGAYGIPQSLPYTKMPKAAWPASAGGSSSAVAQEEWGFTYIEQRYGDPDNAWIHEESQGWY